VFYLSTAPKTTKEQTKSGTKSQILLLVSKGKIIFACGDLRDYLGFLGKISKFLCLRKYYLTFSNTNFSISFAYLTQILASSPVICNSLGYLGATANLFRKKHFFDKSVNSGDIFTHISKSVGKSCVLGGSI
jgi:hypothetical protein